MRRPRTPTIKSGHQAMEASAALMDPKTLRVISSDKRELLEQTVELALQKALAFLSKQIPDDDEEFSRKWAITASLIATVLNVQTKVDELELRREKRDGLEDLMQRMEVVRAARAAQTRMDELTPVQEDRPTLAAAE